MSAKKTLSQILPAMRISFALTLMTSCVLLGAELLGFTPNEDQFRLETRKKVSESLTIQFSVLDPDKDIQSAQKLVRYIVKRNDDILSAGIRADSGKLLFESGNHNQLWENHEGSKASSYVSVPLMKGGRLWGTVEFLYVPLKSDSILGFFESTIFQTTLYMLIIGFFVYLAFMMRTLRQLDPSAVIPERVSTAFDTLSEGVIIIDELEQILLTNQSFSEAIGWSSQALTGKKLSTLDWEVISREKSGREFPWLQVLKNNRSAIGAQLTIGSQAGEKMKFAINASPISGDEGKAQGVLITLDDITSVEQRNTELETVVTRLKTSQDKIQQQNKELSYLATRDPMTGCLNRRAFSQQFETLFASARESDTELSCIMVDLDHFKLVNDNYGHAMGDEVIKFLGELLKSNTRKDDVVGRYGGEEFCVVLPGMSIEVAMSLGERIRLRVKDESVTRFPGGPNVTASLGVASMLDNPQDPGDLNNKADEALYQAKESGRNRVARWQVEATKDNSVGVENVEPVETDSAQPETATVTALKGRIDELEAIASSFSAEIERSKSYDILTGLPNQVLFYDRMQQAIERGFRHGQVAAVLVIDIEMFSQINATLGRAAGDKVLQEVAERLDTVTRKTDGVSRLSLSRFTGDEFAVLFTDLSKTWQVTWAAKRLLDAVNLPAEIEGNTVYLSCHAGISVYPSDADNVEDLLNCAMTAKKFCKEEESELGYRFFDAQMQDRSIHQQRLEKELRHSIDDENWELLYQPKFGMAQANIVSAEAFIRWNHPQRGQLSPYEFIDFAEQRGLIVQIGDWVIEQSARQIRAWMDLGISDCKVAINLSATQLMQKDIVHKILSTLERYEVPPKLFEIEVTETILMDKVKTAVKALNRLQAGGISISIDDFGTGYSSLSLLKNLPIDRLKIDRVFTRDICTDDHDQKIVRTLISMAHSMDLKVVAEGVETQDQYDLLEKLGCDEVQGYFLSRPIAADAYRELVEGSQHRTDTGRMVARSHS